MPPFSPKHRPGRQPGISRQGVETAPRVMGITPNSDRTVGGVAITISGFNFETDASGNPPTVLLGPTPATSVVVVDRNTITAVAPANDAGIVDVSVTNWHDQTGTLEQAFIYTETRILSLTPNYGPVEGGTDVLITGVNFQAGTPVVLFDGVSATDIVRIDAQHISCVTPAHIQGPVDVEVDDAVIRGGFFYTVADLGDALRRNPSLTIREVISQPSICTFKQGDEAAPPTAGQEFTFFDDDDNLLFGGVVRMVEQVYEGQSSQLAWNVTCSDYTAWLNRRRPFGDYANVSVTDIVKDLIAKYAPWVTTNHVQLNLPAISIELDGTEDFASVLTKLTQYMGGGYWRLDYVKDLHFIQSLLNSSGNDDPTVGVGGGDSLPTMITLTQSATVHQAYPEGYYSVRASFVYSNGVEGTPGPWCPPVLMDGIHKFDLAAIPTGAPIGGLTVTDRRIYYRFFGRRTGVLMAPFAQIEDNVTTSLTSYVVSPATFQTPRLPTVAAPAGPGQTPGAAESATTALSVLAGLFPSLAGRVSYTFEPGTWAFKKTHVYDDGTESLPSPASDPVFLDGFHAVQLGTGDLSETVNGHSVIYIKIYASKATATGGVPDFSVSSTFFWAIVPGADTQTVDIIPGLQDVPLITGATQQSQPPVASTEHVSLEEENPDPITDNSDTLLRNPQVSKVVDVTQVRNRVIVYGRGVQEDPHYAKPTSTAAAESANEGGDVYARAVSTLAMSGIIQPARGFPMNAHWAGVIQNYGNTNYAGGSNGVAGSTGEKLGLIEWLDDQFGITKRYIETHPLTVFMDDPEGTPTDTTSESDEASRGNFEIPKVIRPRYQVDNLDSQRYMGEIERDSNGDPTDGVHEVVILTEFETPEECIAFGNAQLAQFAWPLITVKYATRDNKTHPGRMVSIDLTDPPIHGDFLILNVTVDQIKDSAETTEVLEPRRLVTAADPAKFNLDDLLLLIGGLSNDTTTLVAPLSGTRPRDLTKIVDLASAANGIKVVTVILTPRDLINMQDTGVFTDHAIEIAPAPGPGKYNVWSWIAVEKRTATGDNAVSGHSLILRTENPSTGYNTIGLGLNNTNRTFQFRGNDPGGIGVRNGTSNGLIEGENEPLYLIRDTGAIVGFVATDASPIVKVTLAYFVVDLNTAYPPYTT